MNASDQQKNDVDRSVAAHAAARMALAWAAAQGFDSEATARGFLLAAATLASASGARHKGFRIAADQAWERVEVFQRWLAEKEKKAKTFMGAIAVLLGLGG